MRRVVALLILIYVLLPVKTHAQPTITLKPHQICMTSWVTGYDQGWRTATGTRPIPHRTLAVYPPQIPLGTWVQIRGLGTFHAEDTGGAIGPFHLDVYVSTDAQAYALTGHYLACWMASRPVG